MMKTLTLIASRQSWSRRWTRARRGPQKPTSASNSAMGSYAVIVDVEATPARTYDEVAATKTMIQRTQERLGLKPDWLAADTAYGTGKFLHWVIGAGITPHIPVWDMSKREEGILSRADFTFDRERNLYICPQGKFLRTTGPVHVCRTIP